MNDSDLIKLNIWHMENENTGVNTVLIVLLLVIVVGGIVWFFARDNAPAEVPQEEEFKMEVNIPQLNEGAEQTN